MTCTYIRFGINNTARVENDDYYHTVKSLGYIIQENGVEKARSMICGKDYIDASGYPYHYHTLGCHAVWDSIDVNAQSTSSKHVHDDVASMDYVGYYRKWDGNNVRCGSDDPDFFITVMADGSIFTGEKDPLKGIYENLEYV